MPVTCIDLEALHHCLSGSVVGALEAFDGSSSRKCNVSRYVSQPRAASHTLTTPLAVPATTTAPCASRLTMLLVGPPALGCGQLSVASAAPTGTAFDSLQSGGSRRTSKTWTAREAAARRAGGVPGTSPPRLAIEVMPPRGSRAHGSGERRSYTKARFLLATTRPAGEAVGAEPATEGSRGQSRVIEGHRRPSRAINGLECYSNASQGYQRPPRATVSIKDAATTAEHLTRLRRGLSGAAAPRAELDRIRRVAASEVEAAAGLQPRPKVE